MTDVIQHWDMQALVKNYLTKGRDGPSQYSSMFLEIEEISWQLLNGYFYFFFFPFVDAQIGQPFHIH